MLTKTIAKVATGACLAALASLVPIQIGSSADGSASVFNVIRLNNACARGNPCLVVPEPEGCCKDGVCDTTANCDDPKQCDTTFE